MKQKTSITKSLSTILDIAIRPNGFDKPDLEVNSFIDIDVELLRNHCIDKIIIDLDQTMVIQGTSEIPNDYLQKLLALKNHYGQDRICFLTNEPNKKR